MLSAAAFLFIVVALVGAAFAAVEIRRLKHNLRQTSRVRDEWCEEYRKARDAATILRDELRDEREKVRNQRIEIVRLLELQQENLAIHQKLVQSCAETEDELRRCRAELSRQKQRIDSYSRTANTSFESEQNRILQRKFDGVSAQLAAFQAKLPRRDQFGKFIKK